MNHPISRFPDLDSYLVNLSSVLGKAEQGIASHKKQMEKRKSFIFLMRILFNLLLAGLVCYAIAFYGGMTSETRGVFAGNVFSFLAITGVLGLTIAVLTSSNSLADLRIISNTQERVSEMHMAYVGWMLGERKLHGLGITVDFDLQPEKIILFSKPDELLSEKQYQQTFSIQDIVAIKRPHNYQIEIVLNNGVVYRLDKDTRLGTESDLGYEKIQQFVSTIGNLSAFQSDTMPSLQAAL